jgi:hypothetical protein
MDTRALRKAFLQAMERAGQPLERLRGVMGRRGPVREIFRMENGKTVRVRTNNKRALISSADGPRAEDIMNFEGQQDFVGISIPGSRGSVECYLVPSEVAVSALRSQQEQWLAVRPNSPSDVRAIRFDGDPQLPREGFAEKWAQYRLPTATHPAPSNLEQLIADARRAIAAAAKKPESAVRISIEY